jgi:lysophospholipase L1-like esterase
MRSVAIWITTAVLLFAGLGTAALAATPHQPGVGWCTSQGNIGVIGDSISSGWELNGQATDNPTNPGIWVNWFASRYGATVDNQAVAGTSTANYVSGGSLAADTARIANDQNNLDFVMLGTNDWFLSQGQPDRDLRAVHDRGHQCRGGDWRWSGAVISGCPGRGVRLQLAVPVR